MITDLSELHDKIHEILHFGLIGRQLKQVRNTYFTFNSIIQNLLPMRHDTMNGLLNLRCNFLLNIFFQSPKHKWLENQMKPF